MDTAEVPSVNTALLNAARLLQNAEMETDLLKMERIEKLADSWIQIAGMLMTFAAQS
jgi:hypothetical protein